MIHALIYVTLVAIVLVLLLIVIIFVRALKDVFKR